MATKTTKGRARSAPNLSAAVRFVDELIQLELKLDREETKLKPLRDRVTKLREDLVSLYGAARLDGLKTRHGSVSRVERRVFKISDWDEFFAYCKRKGNDDLLGRSLSGEAIKARLSDGKVVPGVAQVTLESIRINKTKARR